METNVKIFGYYICGLVLAIGGFVAFGFSFFFSLFSATIALYIASTLLLGRERLRRILIGEVFILSLIATIVENFCSLVMPELFEFLLALVVWLFLIKHFLIKSDETGWMGALMIAGLGTIVFAIISLVLSLALLFVFA